MFTFLHAWGVCKSQIAKQNNAIIDLGFCFCDLRAAKISQAIMTSAKIELPSFAAATCKLVTFPRPLDSSSYVPVVVSFTTSPLVPLRLATSVKLPAPSAFTVPDACALPFTAAPMVPAKNVPENEGSANPPDGIPVCASTKPVPTPGPTSRKNP